jgi:hypothetical protein
MTCSSNIQLPVCYFSTQWYQLNSTFIVLSGLSNFKIYSPDVFSSGIICCYKSLALLLTVCRRTKFFNFLLDPLTFFLRMKFPWLSPALHQNSPVQYNPPSYYPATEHDSSSEEDLGTSGQEYEELETETGATSVHNSRPHTGFLLGSNHVRGNHQHHPPRVVQTLLNNVPPNLNEIGLDDGRRASPGSARLNYYARPHPARRRVVSHQLPR